MARQPLARWLLWLMVVCECLRLVLGGWFGGQAALMRPRQQLKDKRQAALDLAFNRLRVLESLDTQLRHWTAEVSAGEPVAGAQGEQQVCRLSLVLAGSKPQGSQMGDTCPLNQVPPYMLNLQRMIVGQASSPADAVRLMPYGSLVARSFRQPQPSSGQYETNHWIWRQHRREQGLKPGNVAARQLVVELSLAPSQSPASQEELLVTDEAHMPTHQACHHHRQPLCYWFPMHQKLSSRINGSLELAGLGRERLVEAELHLYKLAPKLLLAAGSPSTPRLKTDLLEVSLYQILANGAPERLLDIRRIDLHSIGWETFYARRALLDWVREPALNLGLVIKAKSMFKEPIGPGLIRFAGWPSGGVAHKEEQVKLQQLGPTTAQQESREFNLSHQPTLVIYTTIES